MMKKFMYVVIATLLIGSQITLSAQNKDNKEKKQRPTPEQMMQMQTNQIIKSLMLDDATAAKFTPIYQNYVKELRECRMMNYKSRVKKDAAQGAEADKTPKQAMTDADIAKMLKDQFAQSRKMLDIREKYYKEFSKILSQKQILRIYQQEKSNANKFRKEFDRRKGQNSGQRPGQGDRQRQQKQHTQHHSQK
ncbi:hypothetical protein [Bacteroides sp.]|uniref:hypothetical protein n=1 Tax=Bacteroides sp. TaxID=29523 RepID=UPI0026022A7F|nr:hypothetical protein [Bacteroides sp.]MDD3037392.1 hypothetical protein [Bacteroides sp.]